MIKIISRINVYYRSIQLITNQCHFLYLQMIFDGNNAVLLIATTYEEDSGLFTCRVTSSAGQVKTSAKLIVKSKN